MFCFRICGSGAAEQSQQHRVKQSTSSVPKASSSMVPMIEASEEQKVEEVHELIQPVESPGQIDDCGGDSLA